LLLLDLLLLDLLLPDPDRLELELPLPEPDDLFPSQMKTKGSVQNNQPFGASITESESQSSKSIQLDE